MAIYVRDGGRGDDDGRVNGSILAPGSGLRSWWGGAGVVSLR